MDSNGSDCFVGPN